MTLIAFFFLGGILSFLAIRSSYWILRFLAGLSWWAVAFYWLSNPPSAITKGSTADTIVILLLFVLGLAFMFMPFWYAKTEGGIETGGKLRLPFIKEEENQPPAPTRGERNTAYRNRVNGALRGRVERRKH